MVQRSFSSSLINTTAPPTGQNSLTCTRFSLRGSETPPKAKPPPYPPSTFFRSGSRFKQKKKETERQESRYSLARCHLGPDCPALATHASQKQPFPPLGNHLAPFEATTEHKKHLPRPDHDKSFFQFLLFSKPAITTKKKSQLHLHLHCTHH